MLICCIRGTTMRKPLYCQATSYTATHTRKAVLHLSKYIARYSFYNNGATACSSHRSGWHCQGLLSEAGSCNPHNSACGIEEGRSEQRHLQGWLSQRLHAHKPLLPHQRLNDLASALRAGHAHRVWLLLDNQSGFLHQARERSGSCRGMAWHCHVSLIISTARLVEQCDPSCTSVPASACLVFVLDISRAKKFPV